MLNFSYWPLTACIVALDSPVRISVLKLGRQSSDFETRQSSCSYFSQSILVSGDGGRWRGKYFNIKCIWNKKVG